MKNEYVRAFVIGSSCFVFFPCFWVVACIKKSERNYDFIPYSFFEPLFLGCMNVLSLIMAKQFHLSNNMRYLLTSIIATILIFIFVRFFYKAYNFTTTREWLRYIVILFLLYFIAFNFIIALLDRYI
jgi:hypothetical protein